MYSTNSYPKSYGSIRKEDYRLDDFLCFSNEKLKKLDIQLFNFIENTAFKTPPISSYKMYPFLNAGWEWSVFKKNSESVIKIPAGVFSEVNTDIYLENTIEAYKLITSYIPSDYIATSRFTRDNGLNIIEQEYLKENHKFILTGGKQNTVLLRHMKKITLGLIHFLREQETIPDIGFRQTTYGYHFFRNILLDQNGFPKLVDFTVYYDPFRIYPKKKKDKLKSTETKVMGLLYWLSSNLNEIQEKEIIELQQR